MQRNLLGVMVISAGIAGCASKPVPPPDNTPLKPTAVIEQRVINNGIKGIFPFESTELHYVRADMRRDEATLKGIGTFSGFLVGTHSSTGITRIDRKLRWSLYTGRQEYTECPLKGCVKPATRPPVEQKAATPEAQHESGCTMHVVHTSFAVQATGQKQSINGFDTSEYRVAWVVKLRDKAARNTTSTLNIEIWTTPLTRAIRDTLAIEASYARAYSGTAAGTGRQQIIPADAATLISAYLASSLKPGDLDAFLAAGKQMQKINGYPILTHLAWNLEGNACASGPSTQAADTSSANPPPASAGGLASSFAGMFAEKKAGESINQAAAEPILSFTTEVKSLRIEPLHDSLFSVPPSYRLVSQP